MIYLIHLISVNQINPRSIQTQSNQSIKTVVQTSASPYSFAVFFSRHGQYFHPAKDQPRTRPSSPFLYICCNFGQILCTNVIQFFSVENMGHNQLKKCRKYHLVSLLNEKQRSTLANFLHLFYPFPS